MAREHGLIVCADEVYDKVLYDDAVHTSIALLSEDVLTLTFNGLSKTTAPAATALAGWWCLATSAAPLITSKA